MEKANESEVEQATEQVRQRQGISPDQLFQQFTKSAQVVQNSFQLLFDGTQEMNQKYIEALQTIKTLKKLLAENGISTEKQPNRKERRAEEKKQRKSKK